MLDLKTEVVAALKTILPTYYEFYCNSDTAIPCITYTEYMNNQDKVQGTNILFSNIGFKIKIWGRLTPADDPTNYQDDVDTAMRNLGYTRTSSNELTVGNQICKIMNYDAYCEEHI